MRKIYLILAIVFLYSSNSVFAQGHHNTYEWEQHIANINHRQFFGESKSYRSDYKNRYTMIYYRHAAESVTDETTGMTTIKWEDGAKYYGQTHFGEIRGIGTIIYPDSSRYCGEWKKDQPNGKGSFISPEGVVFTGKFKDGVPHGKCIMQSPDGKLYKARWVRGVLKEKSIKPLEE